MTAASASASTLPLARRAGIAMVLLHGVVAVVVGVSGFQSWAFQQKQQQETLTALQTMPFWVSHRGQHSAPPHHPPTIMKAMSTNAEVAAQEEEEAEEEEEEEEEEQDQYEEEEAADEEDAAPDSEAAATSDMVETSTSTTTSSIMSSPMSSSSASLLENAFANLDETDKYDAVLTSLCASILDDAKKPPPTPPPPSSDDENGSEAMVVEAPPTPQQRMKDPLSLLTEMNNRGLEASARSIMSLIDAAAATQDSRIMAKVLSLSIQNGAVSNYGMSQSYLRPLPPPMSMASSSSSSSSSMASSSLAPSGASESGGVGGLLDSFFGGTASKMDSREGRLATLEAIPTDNRGMEVASGLAAMAVAGSCAVVDWLPGGVFDDQTHLLANLLLSSMFLVGLTDNFYDALRIVSRFAIEAVGPSAPDFLQQWAAATDEQDEEGDKKSSGRRTAASTSGKPSLPLGLGTGQLTGTVFRGLQRLLTADTERECQCEAAAFVAAYNLGLPCFAFRPNALEAAVLIFDSMRTKQQQEQTDADEVLMADLDPLLSSPGILKVLVWLLAPVAMEYSRYPMLIASDPREGSGLVRRLREKAKSLGFGQELEDILPSPSSLEEVEDEADNLLRWAFAEADILLRTEKRIVTEVAERLAGGAATVGDCVAVVEGW